MLLQQSIMIWLRHEKHDKRVKRVLSNYITQLWSYSVFIKHETKTGDKVATDLEDTYDIDDE